MELVSGPERQAKKDSKSLVDHRAGLVALYESDPDSVRRAATGNRDSTHQLLYHRYHRPDPPPALSGMFKSSKDRPTARNNDSAPSRWSFYSLEIVISLSVINSRSTGLPFLVASIPRSIAPRMSFGSVTRSA